MANGQENGIMRVAKLGHIVLAAVIVLAGIVATFVTIQAKCEVNQRDIKAAAMERDTLECRVRTNELAVGRVDERLKSIDQNVQEQRKLLQDIRNRM